MSKDSEGEANKMSHNIQSKPDDLIKGKDSELTDQQLDKAAGGFGTVKVEYKPQKPDGSLDAP